ncbi:MAG: hypothetical protein DMC60_12095 [Verrucomicrobia bacterium]|nr:MAG: hypothetical protein DMC60_12095 [Verrucomicrobiota bacterium]
MPDRAYLHPIDPELVPGARNAVEVCLRLKPKERITIVTDTVTREIAAALQREVERVGSDYSLFVLEHHARRPLKFMPETILEDLACSQVSILAAQTQPGELTARTQMTTVVNNHRIRHGHMVNINRQIMLEGMRADFRQIDELSQRLVDHARKIDRIRCKTPHGTEFEAEFSPKLEFAIGTNIACTHIIGHILQDEKIPGVHIAFGHPYAEHTGANWVSKTHIDCVGRDFDVWFNGEQVMRDGKFLI